MTPEKIDEFLSSGDIPERRDATEAVLKAVMDCVNQMPLHYADFLGDKLARQVDFILDERPLGADGDDW